MCAAIITKLAQQTPSFAQTAQPLGVQAQTASLPRARNFILEIAN